MSPSEPSQDVLPVPCESCGAQPLRKYPTVNSIMWCCPECRLYQKGRVVAVEDYSLEYHNGYAARRRRKLWTAAIRVSRIANLLDTPRPKLLDVGSSLGYVVQAAGQLGWDAQGVDVNPEVVESCRRRDLRCQVVGGTVLPFADGFFDAVTAWHVIEHVSDVASAVAEWSRVLKPGGVLALETPDSSCWKLKLRGGGYRTFWAPEHTYTFNRENLAPLLESVDLEIVSPPPFGALHRLPPALAAYAVGYQCLKGLQSRVGLSKVFQLFCRRRDAVRPAERMRRTA